MATAAVPPTQRAARQWSLAIAFQEVFTAIVRLRSGRQAVTDAGTFRAQIKRAIQVSEQEARNGGYPPDDVNLALFAAVAFLDESVLNSPSPVFADWSRMPLQEELFGVHVGGEVFFQNLKQILSRPDSAATADLLEVYELCLLLGYRGRYGASGGGELGQISELVRQRISRVRGERRFAPSVGLPNEPVARKAVDRWVRGLTFGAISMLVLSLLLFAGYFVVLHSGASDIRALVSRS
jgi:type VI secretion system protein ImpK